ncbi:unnamed protein product [Dimorphilus gyrociliatus]|uniref:Uncharacterized protein n=1 Tax=Dimorphilus gyrociliatus TaxID=2664684 RepID=A0A7I8WDB8_9ANNE|nr:unnamed protein product [Dimorphilus gyrociliatus]
MTHLRISCPCCKAPRRDSAYQNTQISHFDSRPSINGTGNGNGAGSNPSIEMHEVKNYEFKNDQSKKQMGILKH